MNLARFSVSRPVAAGILNLALLILGLFYVSRMPVSLYPEVSFPFVQVELFYPGASPEQLESKVVKPLEADLSSIKKLSRLIGIIRPGYARVILAFKMSANEREAVDSVREAVSAMKGKFPKDVKEPIIKRVDVGAVPVMILGVESSLQPAVTKKLLDDSLVRVLQKVDGVNEARLLGVGEEQLRFSLDAWKLNALRIPLLDVFDQLSSRLSIIPWGDINEAGKATAVARATQTDDPAFWMKQSVSLRDSRMIRLSDIGIVEKTRSEEFSSVYINGKSGLGLEISKRSDANTAEVVTKIEAAIKNFKLPSDISLFQIVNQRDFIIENAHEVWIALFVGGAFAVLVILLFLTDLRSALITATALPVSIAGTFIFMSWLDFSLNMMSLLALALAIGLLIDDAVVVREAIYSELENGKSPKEAAVVGTDKVASAVLATSLAILAVFLPVGMMTGLVGQFFKQFGLTIAIAVTISTWVAFTLDPMLSAHVAGKPKPFKGKIWDLWRSFLTWVERKTAGGAKIAFRHPFFTLLAAVAMLVFSSWLILSKGADFLAFEDRAQFVVSLRAPVGSSKQQTEKYVQEAATRLKNLEGLQETFAITRENQDDTKASLRLVFNKKTQRKTGLLELQKQSRDLLVGLGAEFLVMDPPPIEGIAGEAPVSVFVYGTDLAKLRDEALSIKGKLEAMGGLSTVRLETSSLGPTYDITLNSEDLSSVGTTSTALELSGRIALTGLEMGSVGDENLPFVMRYREQDRSFKTLWDSLLIPTQKGPMILNKFASYTENEKARAIDRERRSRKITIWATLDRSITYGQVLEKVKKILEDVKEPFSAEISGDKEMFEEMVSSFGLAIIGSFFFIFIILAIQFENLFRPFVILLSLPLAMIGGFIALHLIGQQLAMGALIGLILLIGLAAKNGILLVDAIGVKEKDADIELAVFESVLERTRPILMTSIAMIFGMIPTALLKGDGSEFRSPMAYSIIGGVISSTMLSFFVVPAIFGLIHYFKVKLNKNGRASHVVVGLLLCFGLGFEPKVFAGTIGVVTLKKADMDAVRRLVGELPSDAAERISIESAEAGSVGATEAARLAFLGGMKATATRQWLRPEVVTQFSIPTPVGPQGFKQIIVPKEQNILSFGWSIPLINIQALEGLKLSNTLQSQLDLVESAKYESATLKYVRAWMEFELSHLLVEVQKQFLANAQLRLETISKKKKVGLATKIDESMVLTQKLGARLQLEKATSDKALKKRAFEDLTGKLLPNEGLGLPSFPDYAKEPFKSSAVLAMEGLYKIQMRQLGVNDASFYPTLSFDLGYEKKMYAGGPKEGTKVLAIKGEWTILDGGTRIRGNAQGKQAALDAFAQMRDLERSLSSNYNSLEIRRKSLESSIQTAEEIVEAAKVVRNQSWNAVESGLMKLMDFRDAEEGLLKAQITILQLLFEKEALTLETLYLTGNWEKYVKSPSTKNPS